MVILVVQERAQIFISYLDGLLLRRYTKKRSLNNNETQREGKTGTNKK